MPRNPLLDSKRVHVIKVCLDDDEMLDVGALAAADDRSPSQLVAHMARTAMYGRIGDPLPARKQSSEANWGQVTLQQVGFAQRDIDALDLLSRQHRQSIPSVLLQLVRVGLYGRVIKPAEESPPADFVDSLFGPEHGGGV
jgi:hypothetical protein